jgi:LmbE family N-acetylglucosaminyl deacetylase
VVPDVGKHVIEPGAGRTLLLVVAHADDPALFLGGTLALWAQSGWRIVAVRATDDRWDSFGLDEGETRARIGREFAAAARILGIAEIVELGWPTDRMAALPRLELRAQIIAEIRRWRPHTLVTFDPNSVGHEDNQDHVVLAEAVDEAAWTAQFDKHEPQQIARGLAPHGVFERWYFGRRVAQVTHVVDIAATLPVKLEAALATATPLHHIACQLQMQARTGGWRAEPIDRAVAGELRPLFADLLRRGAGRVGAAHGLAAAEEFRVVRMGGLGEWLAEVGEPLPSP